MSTNAGVIHVAGPWRHGQQFCTRCGELLKSEAQRNYLPYPEGALIMSTRTYQAILLTVELPTCQAPQGSP
jgi:hypothetical protein